jgi:hypothetical protein
MESWWGALGTELQVFYAIAIATTALLVAQLVLLVSGVAGGEGELHGAADAHGDTGVGILSVRTVTAFFTGFGWAGVVALEAGKTLGVAIVWAVASGTAFMLGVFFLMRGLYSLRESGTLDFRNAVGAVGTVYLPIPGEMAGPGQIEVLFQGRLQVVQAFTRVAQRLPNRTRVRVTELLDPTTLVVEPLEAPRGEE